MDGASLARYDHLDLPGIVKALLDFVRDVVGKAARPVLVDLFRFDDNAHFATGLDRERFLHAGKRVRDIFKRLQAFDVKINRLTASARSLGSNCIRGLYDGRLQAPRL